MERGAKKMNGDISCSLRLTGQLRACPSLSKGSYRYMCGFAEKYFSSRIRRWCSS